MALSHSLEDAGYTPDTLEVTVTVSFQPGDGVLGSDILLRASVPELLPETFATVAEDAKANCPISQAFRVPIS